MVLILDGNAEIGAHVDEHYVFLDLFKAFEYKYHNISKASAVNKSFLTNKVYIFMIFF